MGPPPLHRYRVIVQTIVEPSDADSLTSVELELTATCSDGTEIVVDAISPQPGFSAIGLKSSKGTQHGTEETAAEKATVGSELSATGAKVSSSIETSRSVKESSLFSIGTERSIAQVEQYLIARKAGNRAMWRALAGVGPIDASGLEYMADLLVPDSVPEMQVSVEAKVDWLYAGTTPAAVQKTFSLPRPRQMAAK